MNIATINAVSFEGKWRKKQVCTKEGRVGTIGNNYYNIVHTYHPYADETPSEIKKAMAEEQAEFAKAKPKIVEAALDGNDIYRKVVNEKLGERLLSPQQTAKLEKQRATLMAEKGRLTSQLTRVRNKLAKITKQLALKPKPKAMTPRRHRKIAELGRAFKGI